MKKFFKRIFVIILSTLTLTNALTLSACKEEVDLSTLKLTCIGDSLTLGEGIEFAYANILANTYGMKDVRNYGVSWSTCAVVNECSCHHKKENSHNSICLRYSQMPTNADVIAVMCGVNDSGLVPLGTIDDTINTTFYGSLNILCSKLKEEYTRSYIFFMTSFHYDISEEVREDGTMRKDYYEKAVKEVCAKYQIDVFDTYNTLDFSTKRDTVDDVHPNQEFVTNVWAPAIAQYIKDNYKKN